MFVKKSKVWMGLKIMNIFKNPPFLSEYKYRCKIQIEDKLMGWVHSQDLPKGAECLDVSFTKEDGTTLVEVHRVIHQRYYRWQIFCDHGAIWIYFNIKGELWLSAVDKGMMEEFPG